MSYFAVLVTMLIVALVLGMLYTRFIIYKRNSILLNFVSGILIMFASFQLIALPSIFLNCTFIQLSTLYLIIIAILSFTSIILNINRLKLIKEKLIEYKRKITSSEKKIILAQIKEIIYVKINGMLILVLVIMFGQMILYQFVEYRIWSVYDMFYVGTATTTIHTNQIFRFNPFTGMPLEVFFEQYILSPYFIFHAFISNLFNVPPTIFIRNILPMLLKLFCVSVYFLIGQNLFKCDFGKAIKFTFFCQIIILFSGVGLGSLGHFALLQLYLGDSLLYLALLPLCFYFYMKLFHCSSTKADWIMLTILVVASSLVSTNSIILTTFLLGVLGLVHLISTKRVKEVCKMALCCTPNVFLGFLFILSSSSGLQSVLERWGLYF